MSYASLIFYLLINNLRFVFFPTFSFYAGTFQRVGLQPRYDCPCNCDGRPHTSAQRVAVSPRECAHATSLPRISEVAKRQEFVVLLVLPCACLQHNWTIESTNPGAR
jgi:hypothetical protein